MDALDAAYAAQQSQVSNATPTQGGIVALADKYITNPASVLSPASGNDPLDAAYAKLNGAPQDVAPPPGAKTRQEYMASEGGIPDSPSYEQYVAMKRNAIAEQSAIDNESLLDKALGMGLAGVHTVAGMVGGTLAAPGEVVKQLVSHNAGDAYEKWVMNQFDSPLNASGQRYAQKASDVLNDSGIGAVAPLAEMSIVSHLPISGKLGAVPVLADIPRSTLAEQSTADAVANILNIIKSQKEESITPNVWSKGAPNPGPVIEPLSDAYTPSQIKDVLDTLKDQQKAVTPSQLNGVAENAPTPAVVAPKNNFSTADAAPIAPVTLDDFSQTSPSSAMPSVDRLNEARSLPEPIDLTLGQATGDIHQLSFEQNNRGNIPALGDRFNNQNAALLKNLDAVRESMAPDINVAPGIATDQALVDAIKGVDAPMRADISAKYQALKDANGGQFPVSGQDFVNAADKALKADNVTRFAPPEVKGLLDDLRTGGPMNLNDFENYRTILGQQARKFAQSGDGTAEHAVNLVRNALESVPMSNEAAAIKPLADAARQAAAARFKLIASDPAYKAAVNDGVAIGEASPVADKFIQKYIINGKTANVKNLMENLSDDPKAQQIMAAGIVDHLKQSAGIDLRTNAGNINQAPLNKAIASLGEKKGIVLDPQSANTIDSIGNVARYTQQQPKGSYVNNSNTLVAGLSGKAKKGAEMAVNAAVPGLGLGTEAVKFIERRGQTKLAGKALNPELAEAPKISKIQALKNEAGYAKDAVFSGAKSVATAAKNIASADPHLEAEIVANAARKSAHIAPTLVLAEQQAANMQRLREAEEKAKAQRELARKILPALR